MIVPSTGDRRLGFVALLCAVAIATGAVMARGGLPAYVLLATVSLALAAILFVRCLDQVLFAWVALEGIAYPFIRYPLHHNVASFDRFIVLAMGGALLLSSGQRLGREGRVVFTSFGIFVVAYGLRAFFTHPLPPPRFFPATSSYLASSDWLDQAAMPFVMFVVGARILTSRARWTMLTKVFTVLGASVATLGIGQWITGFDLSKLSGSSAFVDKLAGAVRVSGPYQEPVTYGSVLVICLVATIYLLRENGPSLPVLTALSLELVGLAPSLTKTIWIAAFIAGVIASGLRRRVNSRTVLVALYAAGVLGVVYSLLQSSPIVAERVTGSNANFVTRLGDYVQGIYIFEHWPLTGAGIQQFIPAQSLVDPVTIGGVAAGPSAHNTFISVLAETGVLGFLPLLFLVYALITTVRAVRRRAHTDEEIRFSAVILAAVVGYFLLSLTLVQIYYPTAAMLLALMLGAAAARLPSLGGTPPRARRIAQAPSD
jgi:O-antigen ligase